MMPCVGRVPPGGVCEINDGSGAGGAILLCVIPIAEKK